MIRQSFEEVTEQPTTMTSSKSAGRRSLMVLRYGHLKIGYQLWQKEEELRKDINAAWIQTLPINSCTVEQFKDSRDNAIDPALQDNVLLPKGFTEYIYHVGNASELNFIPRNGLITGRKSIGSLHYSESDGWWKWYGRNSMRSDETKDRAMQEYLETFSTYCI